MYTFKKVDYHLGMMCLGVSGFPNSYLATVREQLLAVLISLDGIAAIT